MMMVKIVNFLVCFVVTIAAIGQSIEQTFVQIYNLGKYEDAINLAQDHVDSLTLSSQYLLSSIYARNGRQAQSKDICKRIIEKDTTHEAAHSLLASIYEQQQYFSKASKHYTILNDLYPDNAYYYRKNAKCMARSQAMSEAFKMYAKAYQLQPSDLITIEELADILIDNGAYEEADSILMKGIALDSTHVGLHYTLSTSKYKQKEYADVVRLLLKLERMVDFAYYHHKMLGYAYMQIDSIDLAIQRLQRSIADDKNPEKTHYYLSKAYEIKGEYPPAQGHIEEAIALSMHPDLGTYYRNLARIHDRQNRPQDAIPYYKKAIEYNEDYSLYYYLARACDIYYKDKSIAVQYYHKFVELNDSPASYIQYAKDRASYLKEQRHQEGK